jgi:hypothetical protein
VTTPWERYKDKLGTTRPWDLLNPNAPKADESTQEHRMSICKECPELINLTKQCKQCGCVMTAKVKLLVAECPLNKW